MSCKLFLSPGVSRKVPCVIGSPRGGRRRRQQDEMDLIMTSPTDSEHNSILNGNSDFSEPNVGFSMPKIGKKGAPMTQKVVQSLRLQSSSKNYSELGSCPSLPGGGGGGGGVGGGLGVGSRPLLTRTLINENAEKPVEEMVQTATGKILVARQGDPSRPAIITYHDLGLNYLANFQTFFHTASMSHVLDTFCVYHVTAPGQESGAEDLPEDFTYPSMDALSEQVEYVLHYYGIPHCVCFGIGLGSNVLVRFARRRPTMVDGLILVNCTSQTPGWLEWVYNKVNVKNLKKQMSATNVIKLPDSVVEYLIWYHLGRTDADGRTLDTVSLVSIYKQHFSCEVNPRNFSLLLQAYMQRSDLNLAREIATNGKPLFGATRTLQQPVLNMTGDHSPHVEATVAFNGRLQPNKCTWMKIQDAAMVLEEQPGKVAEAVKLFLQGLGHVFRPKKLTKPPGPLLVTQSESKQEEASPDKPVLDLEGITLEEKQ